MASAKEETPSRHICLLRGDRLFREERRLRAAGRTGLIVCELKARLGTGLDYGHVFTPLVPICRCQSSALTSNDWKPKIRQQTISWKDTQCRRRIAFFGSLHFDILRCLHCTSHEHASGSCLLGKGYCPKYCTALCPGSAGKSGPKLVCQAGLQKLKQSHIPRAA